MGHQENLYLCTGRDVTVKKKLVKYIYREVKLFALFLLNTQI